MVSRIGVRLAEPGHLIPAAGFLLAFFVVPVAYGIYLSWTGSTHPGDAYRELFSSSYYLKVLLDTVLLGIIVTIVCVVLGYPCAYFLTRQGGALADIVAVSVIAPLAVSAVIQSFGWVVILGNQGPVYKIGQALGLSNPPILMHQWPGLAIALVQILLPYMVISIASVMGSIPSETEEAARTLGASPWRVLTKVTIPLSLDGIATGAILVFMLAIGGIVTVILVGSGSTMIVPLLIYQQINNTGDYAFAAALGNVLLLAAVILLVAQSALLRTRSRA